MALTPEDVVNKRFQPTKFREGYDQDEVDDFLDEVVVELRRLGQENEELRQRLAAGDAQISELQRAGGGAAQQATPAAQPVAPAAQADATAQAQAGFPGGDQSSDPNNTNNLLQLARRLHEEHVREGIEKRDALIAEGHATAARIVSEAESQKMSELSSLEQERVALESRVEDLRSFEREYRAKLKGHIEGILHDLDGTAVPVGAPAQGGHASANIQQDPAAFGTVPAQPQAGYPGFGGN
ncbi:MAG: DivIVA domain-containing protein [Cryobacterium sp.]|jgi:DivIVA domain-containing protein|nr:DivIVA domain-containing protein [Cryobacterium sp.]